MKKIDNTDIINAIQLGDYDGEYLDVKVNSIKRKFHQSELIEDFDKDSSFKN